ncbi:hypothetical protein VTJ83DRAFT_5546 [Remersonia thermophila]|uniref:DBF4-type domain-containing protein n=1 Tax=Remersonia thermophila TaxID=72144 RepID=A0ABR4D824_9PEZI
MAAASTTPAPPPPPQALPAAAMSSRRVPLSASNPNVAHSPLRAASAASDPKKVRSHADMMREEPYGQPPPAKRLMVERGVASPSRSKPVATITTARAVSQKSPTKAIAHRSASRAAAVASATHKSTHVADLSKATEEELNNIRAWRAQIRARFPKMVFYFESIPDDQRARLAKQVARLGAREEKFFSINISHVVTSRPIPPEKPKGSERESVEEVAEEQPKTIDPSLLNRAADPMRSRLVFDKKPSVSKTRSTDVLDRARDMGKKIWSLEKLHKILELALHSDAHGAGTTGASGRSGAQAVGRTAKDNLAQLLEKERVYGPSDRDPTVSSRDIVNFRGYYIYIYDVEEKTKPIMIREYAKVSDPKDGDWPQFRLVSEGRCPFIIDESYDADRENRERARAKARAAKAAAQETAEKAATPAPREDAPAAVTGKRTLTQMEDGQNRGVPAPAPSTGTFDRSRVCNPPVIDFTQNAFISHAKGGRLLAGEPVASGLQPSNVTSAIRSQAVSSTTGGVLGAKAGTSKEIHGLQRKVVLQKASMPALSQEAASRRALAADGTHDGQVLVRSASANQALQRLEKADEEPRQREKLRRTASVPVSQPKKRDPKPGYCENCQDKFADFDEHIVSRKHRKFAENDDNWAQLDALLAQLKRVPRF